MKDLRRETTALKEMVADFSEKAVAQKRERGWGERGMRSPAPEENRII